MAIDNKSLLTVVKAFDRANPLPLDSKEVWDSLELAQSYVSSPIAYPGQTIKVLINGKYKTYILQPTAAGGLLLEESNGSGGVSTAVEVLDELPTVGAQGVIYIVGQEGYIWTGTEYREIFTNTTVVRNEITLALEEKLGEFPENTTVKAYIDASINAGGTDVADDIMNAKNEAIAVAENYTDTEIAKAMTITQIT